MDDEELKELVPQLPEGNDNSTTVEEESYVLRTSILVLFLLAFFGLIPFNLLPNRNGYFDYIYFPLTFMIGISAVNVDIPYSKQIRWYLCLLLLSCIYSWLFNGQSLHVCVIHSYCFFAIFFFFYLVKIDFSASDTMKVLEIVALCFCICYIIQWMIYPVALFASAYDNVTINRYEFRMRMPGSICCYYIFLYGINQFVLKKNAKSILYCIIGLIPMMIQGFRSLIALSMVAAFFMIPFVVRKTKQTVLFVVFGVGMMFLFFTTNLAREKVAEMMERQESDQTFGNEDYIRFLSFDYYWNHQFVKPYEKIVGGGFPIDVNSRYYKTIEAEKEQHGFYWDDLGIIGLGMIIGFPTMLLLVSMYIRCIWKCKEPDIQSVRFTLFVVLIGSIFTSRELYREGNILLLSLFLYLEYKYHAERLSLPES